MRYLRKYNEEIDRESDPEFFLKLQNDFKLFANECLVYLIDDGFTISIEIGSYKPDFMLLNNNTTTFTWSDIKDDFIPFIELTKEKFEILNQFSLPFYIITTEGNYTKSLEDMINDDMGIINDREIKGIQFKIKDYK
jgi:hypothetical protein